MTPRLARYAASVLVAGLVGHLASVVFATMLIDEAAFWAPLTAPGRVGVAVATAALLPPIHRRFPFIVEDLVSLVALTLVATLLWTTVLTPGMDWYDALMLNAVYAGAALVAYRFAAEWGRPVND
jgi:hypothetical protein